MTSIDITYRTDKTFIPAPHEPKEKCHWASSGAFPSAGRFGEQRYGTDRVFHCQNWAWPGLNRIKPYSFWSRPAPLLGYWDTWKGAGGKFELHTPSVDWATESHFRATGDNNKQTHYLRGISGQQRKLRLLMKMLRKSFPSILDVLHCCALFIVRILLFPWIY